MNRDEVEKTIRFRAGQIAKLLEHGYDVELRRDRQKGIKVIKVKKDEA